MIYPRNNDHICQRVIEITLSNKYTPISISNSASTQIVKDLIFNSTFPPYEMLNGSIPSLDIFKPIPGQNIAQGGNMANTRVRMSFGHSSGTCIRNLLIPPKDNIF